MARPVRTSNPELRRTLSELRRAAKAHSAPIWASVADELVRARHQVDPVNVGHLQRFAAPKETIVVPGKLLADGRLTKALTVAAYHYSANARSKIQNAGGSALSLMELVRAKPDGAGVRLVGGRR